MNRKLTLSMDSRIIDFAHDFSKKSKKSISSIVEIYFRELQKQNPAELPKYLDELYGIFKGEKSPDKKELKK